MDVLAAALAAATSGSPGVSRQRAPPKRVELDEVAPAVAAAKTSTRMGGDDNEYDYDCDYAYYDG